MKEKQMGFMDKLRNRFQMAKGHGKERAGQAVGSPDLEARGQADRVEGGTRQVGENGASGVDEDAPWANRHSFLDDIETPLADQDGRTAGHSVPVTDEDASWTDHGLVPPTQIDVPPDQAAPPRADEPADEPSRRP
jgi:uncharacterized protein YjbJ (UPF0337 family)